MSKIVEKDQNLLKDALMEYNAIKEEAIRVAKDRLAKSMPDVIENFLKEELEKSMEEGIISTDETMIDDQESSVMETMKDVDSPVSESEDESDEDEKEHLEEESDVEDDELTAKAIEEALRELEGMDDEDEMSEDEEIEIEDDLEEDASFSFDLEDDKLTISDIESHGKEFDDIEFELELDDEEGMGDEMESEEGDELELSDDMDSEEEVEDSEIDFDSLGDEEEVEEGLSHVMTHQNAKQVGSENNVNYGKKERLRPAMQESKLKKDIEKLIKENEELKSINVEFKEALKKYKTQLYEMAVFNANLSHVNNLFVEHTTTVDEKKEILNKFKSVSTIEESKKVYSGFVNTLNESKKSKKTIEEMVQKPTNGASSTSERLTESLNKGNHDDAIKAIKQRMMYLENRSKK